MTQNIYDKKEFFKGYSRLNRSVKGLEGAPEWPSIKVLLPNLSGKRVIDIVCGFGWFARFAMTQGAKNVLGIDISERMIKKAKANTSNPAITYEIADLEDLELPNGAFDFAYSSLVFHYVQNFNKLISTIYRALMPKSDFIFTIEHPIYMAPSNPKFTTDNQGHRIWPLNNYAIEGARVTNWLTKGIIKQHRTLGTTLNTLIETGFNVLHVEEWAPNAKQLKKDPELEEEIIRPTFLLVAAKRS